MLNSMVRKQKSTNKSTTTLNKERKKATSTSTSTKEKKINTKVQTSINSSIKVAVRVRPKSKKEETEKEQPVLVDGKIITIVSSVGETHAFTCDNCFTSDYSSTAKNNNQQQKEVYEHLAKPLLSQAFQGFNTCLFAYGQTGTGKSYSMMGKIGSNSELSDASGIIPRFCKDLFTNVDELVRNFSSTLVNVSIEIQISYFEIYKEQIQDLLCSSGGKLSVREHPKNGPYVVNLTKCLVTSFEEVQRWLAVGNRKRVVASTSENKRSSRSHVVFTIVLSQSLQETINGRLQASAIAWKQSRINFIDLAGSERLAFTSKTGVRREESLAINLSLFTLGKVITALAEKKFAPYRESVLTWLLKDSLGGNSKTVMLATVSPSSAHVESTLSTLRYSCLAAKIVNTARICEDPKPCPKDLPSVEPVVVSENIDHSPSRVRELEGESRYLKTLLAEVEGRKDAAWKEKVTQAELRRAEAEEALANYGLSSVLDPQQPYLVNVNRDPLLSQTMFFPLHPGENWVGPMEASNQPPAIQLTGLMIEYNHCCIEFFSDLKLIANAETYVNGQIVDHSAEVILRHGDRIVIGGSHFFHLHNPRDSHFNEKHADNEVVDFETSYHELRQVQEKSLEVAIKEAQEKARLVMITEIKELRQEAASEISFRRHFYENEITSINRGLLQKQNISSPPLPPSFQSNNWQEIEFLLRETQRQLEQQPINSQKESSFVIQSMLNEANAICRRFQQPYIFYRKEAITEDLDSAICVQDKNRCLLMYWSFDTMRQRLKKLRVAVEESNRFPMEAIYDSGDVWHREDDASSFFAPNTRAKLEELLRTLNNSSIISPDGSKFSPNSLRRSSLLPRPPTNFNVEAVAACRELLPKFSMDGCLILTFCDMASSIQHLLDHPDRTLTFAIGLTVKSISLLSIFSGLVDFMFTKRQVHSSLRDVWLKSTQESGKRLQNSLEFVMQGVSLESSGLFLDWIQLSKIAFEKLLIAYCELSVVFCADFAPNHQFLTFATALSGFTSAHKKVQESSIVLAEEIRMQIEQLPSSSPNPSLTHNNGCLVTNACYDSVHHFIGLLEELRHSTEDAHSFTGDMELGDLHSKFHQRVDLLFRLGETIDHMFENLNNQVLSQVKVCATALKKQAGEYTNLMGVTSETLCDLSFSILTVHRHVSERKRRAALQKGRNIIYSPVPSQMLVTPSLNTKNGTRNV